MEFIGAIALRLVLRGLYVPVTSYFTGFPRPDGPPRAVAPGHSPFNILLSGTDIANGWGVRHHDLALPGHLARSLSELTGRGSIVTLAADPRLVGISKVALLMRTEPLSTYHAVVIITGLFDAAFLTSGKTWRFRMTALITDLESRTPPSTPIVIVGIPPISGIVSFGVHPRGLIDRRAALLNQITEQLCSSSDRCHYLPMKQLKARQPGPGVSGPSEQFRGLAREQAVKIAALMRENHPVNGDI